MNNQTYDQLIALYASYVALLEREISEAVAFLNQNGRPIKPRDIIEGKELVAKIAEGNKIIKFQPSSYWSNPWYDYNHTHDYDTTAAEERAKQVVANAVTVALAGLKQNETEAKAQLTAEGVVAATKVVDVASLTAARL